VDLTIKNKGNTYAKDVNLNFSKEVEIKGLMVIEELKPNQKKSLKIGFKPLQAGEVPLMFNINYINLA
jgi:hypothetical protein